MRHSFKCGGKTITFDDMLCKDWTFTCTCTRTGCHHEVSCLDRWGSIGTVDVAPAPRGNGGGTVKLPAGVYSVSIRGGLKMAAKSLEKRWGRDLVVPANLRDERVSRRVTGTPEEIVEKLGLRFR